MTTPPLIRTEQPQDAQAVDALVERAFGPGRYAKAAERLREGNRARADLSFTAWAGETLVGSVRLWPIRVGAAPVIFLGPIAVDPAFRSQGLGQTLVERACDAARAAGFRAVLLVGDAPWFDRAGFSAEPTRRIEMPGPVDPRRVLARELVDGGAADLEGRATAA